MTEKKRVGILISGRGSNMRSLIKACKDPDYPAEIAVVISNRPDAKGLILARKAGVNTQVIDHKTYSSREEFEDEINRVLEQNKVEFLCNAGFMRLLTARFVEKWKDHQLNIHPSLLPAFKGLNTHERVLEAGARISGCTVHFVRADMDSGPIIAQAAVPVLPDDTPKKLADRVLAAEHQLYPLALKLVANGTVRVVAERVVQSSDAGATSNRTHQSLLSPSLDT